MTRDHTALGDVVFAQSRDDARSYKCVHDGVQGGSPSSPFAPATIACLLLTYLNTPHREVASHSRPYSPRSILV